MDIKWLGFSDESNHLEIQRLRSGKVERISFAEAAPYVERMVQSDVKALAGSLLGKLEADSLAPKLEFSKFGVRVTIISPSGTVHLCTDNWFSIGENYFDFVFSEEITNKMKSDASFKLAQDGNKSPPYTTLERNEWFRNDFTPIFQSGELANYLIVSQMADPGEVIEGIVETGAIQTMVLDNEGVILQRSMPMPGFSDLEGYGCKCFDFLTSEESSQYAEVLSEAANTRLKVPYDIKIPAPNERGYSHWSSEVLAVPNPNSPDVIKYFYIEGAQNQI